MKKIVVLGITGLLMVIGFVMVGFGVAEADQSHKNDDKKVWICHHDNGKPEWKAIEISENALDSHLKHQWGKDIYPVPADGCPATVVEPEPTDEPTDPETTEPADPITTDPTDEESELPGDNETTAPVPSPTPDPVVRDCDTYFDLIEKGAKVRANLEFILSCTEDEPKTPGIDECLGGNGEDLCIEEDATDKPVVTETPKTVPAPAIPTAVAAGVSTLPNTGAGSDALIILGILLLASGSGIFLLSRLDKGSHSH